MKTHTAQRGTVRRSTWEEESGFLRFLARVPAEVERFNRSFGFGLNYSVAPPEEIDGGREEIGRVGFVVIRDNPLLPERRYCLYSVLEEGVLCGYIGLYDDGGIRTLRELRPLKEFNERALMELYDWFRALMKASCDKL